MTFERYAIYFAPPPDHPLAEFGKTWLGWDPVQGRARETAPVGDFTEEQWRRFTASPRRYGFHGTLKPPMRLVEGESRETLTTAIASLAGRIAPFSLGALMLARLGRFLALIPAQPPQELPHLARECVTALDRFRAPAPEAELARRRKAGLSARQEDYLLRWGYPYVMEEFRFHLTVSSGLESADIELLQPVLERLAAPAIAEPVDVRDICLFGDPGGKANFELLERFPLSAPSAAG